MIRTLLIATTLCLTSACALSHPSQLVDAARTSDQHATQTTEAGLKVATWNVEHLAYPPSAGCKPRSDAELAELQAYAASLEADIVALQEVSSTQAVNQLFPDNEWQIFMSDRPDSEAYVCRESGFRSTQQKVAYAVRRDVSVTSVASLSEFGLANPGLRYGLELTVNTDLGAFTLLNVHMKSGCFVDNFSRSERNACQTFAEQAPVLDGWIEQREAQGVPYIALGDFNHRLSAPYNHLTRTLHTNSNGSDSSLSITTAPMIGCHPYYPAPIDHIMVGNLPDGVGYQPATYHPFDDMAPEAMLSDHCAVSLQLRVNHFALSTAVDWHTKSKEYRYLTTAIYMRAQQTITEQTVLPASWVVVMDIDETVLDNSAYQVIRDRTATGFSEPTWNAWVAAEQATLVPGAKDFIETVIAAGGKLALVTNRDRELDHHTWANLLAAGLPLDAENTCLMGRSAADKRAINGSTIINDKDLRRQQVEAGNASCFSPETGRHQAFDSSKIIMQVGDNIEDFEGLTQEDADPEALISRANGSLVLLPNAMYGSWSH